MRHASAVLQASDELHSSPYCGKPSDLAKPVLNAVKCSATSLEGKTISSPPFKGNAERCCEGRREDELIVRLLQARPCESRCPRNSLPRPASLRECGEGGGCWIGVEHRDARRVRQAAGVGMAEQIVNVLRAQ